MFIFSDTFSAPRSVCWMCGTSAECAPATSNVSLEELAQGNLEALREAVHLAQVRVDELRTRVHHALVSRQVEERQRKFIEEQQNLAFNLFEPDLYKNVLLDVRQLLPYVSEDWMRIRVAQLFQKYRYRSLDAEIEASARHDDEASRCDAKIPCADETKRAIRRLQLALHPDKCMHPRADEAFRFVLNLAKQPALSAGVKIHALDALLPDVDAVLKAMYPDAAAPSAESRTNRSMQDIVEELREWTRSSWYRWTENGFGRPSWYVAKEALGRLHEVERRSMVEEDEKARKKALARHEKPACEDLYAAGIRRHDQTSCLWWRKYSSDRVKKNLALADRRTIHSIACNVPRSDADSEQKVRESVHHAHLPPG